MKIDINTRSIVFRSFFIYVTGLLVLVISFALSFYWLSDVTLNHQLDQQIKIDSDGLVEYYEIGDADLVTTLLTRRLRSDSRGTAIYLLADQNFRAILGNISEWPPEITDQSQWGEIEWEQRDENLELRYYHRKLKNGTRLLVGRENEQVESFERKSVTILFVTFGFSLLVVAFSGWRLAQYLQGRFLMMEQACDMIGKGHITKRISVGQNDDEIDRVASTLNSMLDQIEILLANTENVSYSIAHDLRTPLTRLRGRLEGLNKNTTEEEWDKEVLASISDVDSLLSTFRSLLEINRVETGGVKQDFEAVDFHRILEDAVDLYEPLADQRHQTLEFHIEENLSVFGARDLLFQCVANILDNAIKYAPSHSTISVDSRQCNNHVELKVQDKGPGIPEDEIGKVFNRFYRVDRSRHQPGNGLGLSLVLAVVELHGGTIQLVNNDGFLVDLRIPCESPN